MTVKDEIQGLIDEVKYENPGCEIIAAGTLDVIRFAIEYIPEDVECCTVHPSYIPEEYQNKLIIFPISPVKPLDVDLLTEEGHLNVYTSPQLVDVDFKSVLFVVD